MLDQLGNIVAPYSAETHVSSSDFQLKVGKGFVLGPSVQLTPYVSYLYRQWERDLSRDPYGNQEVYEHNAYAVGLLAQWAVTPNLVLSLDGAYGKTFSSHMEAKRVNIMGDSYTFNYSLRSRPLYMASIGLDYRAAEKLHFYALYQYTQFRYGESQHIFTATQESWEPSSKSKISQLYLGAGYGF